MLQGLKLSFQHFREATESRKPMGIDKDDYFEQDTGLVTLQYPKESLPVPDNGRYRLHNEIEDCIVCDKCAKICPVDCIEIEPVRAVGEIGKTADGTSKRLYAAKFDIDMAKCCFCGLCTTVCPTECLTMTKAYDFSEFDVADHIYAFSEMTPLEILQKKQELDAFNKQKEEEKAAKSLEATPTRPATARPGPGAAGAKGPESEDASAEAASSRPAAPKPAFRPRVKPSAADPADLKGGEAARPKPSPEPMEKGEGEDTPKAKPKPVFRPKVKPAVAKDNSDAKPKPVLKPKIKQEAQDQEPKSVQGQQPGSSTGRMPKPVMKPKIKVSAKEEGSAPVAGTQPDSGKGKPRPVMKPKIKAVGADQNKTDEATTAPPQKETEKGTARPGGPRPIMKPKIKASTKSPSEENDSEIKEKPARPLIRPKVQLNSAGGEEKGAPSEETKKPMPVVKPTGVPHNPSEAEKSESDKEEEQKVKPNYKPKPVIRKKKDN